MTKTLNQTQRKYMIEQLNRAIRSKKTETHTLNLPKWRDDLPSLQTHYHWGDPDPIKNLQGFLDAIDFVVKNKVQIKKEAKEFCYAVNGVLVQNKKLDKLQVKLTSELMLGNDLTDLIEVLKKVEDA